MTQEQLQQLCLEWQKRLRLQDWDVEVKFVRHYELDGKGQFGLVSYSRKKTHAVISLALENDVDPSEPIEYDPEVTLVHELLHIHFSKVANPPDGSPEGVALEQVIHALSRALLSLKRQGKE